MQHILDVQHLAKRFGSAEVLSDINFSLAPGEVVSIIGSSGSGKTTLLRCLNFLEQPDAGRILVNGETLFDADDPATKQEKNLRHKRLHFGLVFQSFHLFPQYTAKRNITLAMELHARERKDYRANKREILREISKRAEELLFEVNLSDKANHYPYQPSGGQQQRIAIARALALNPEILCFDEPTSALDPELSAEVLATIRRLAELGRTMILVTHEMSFARQVSSRVLFMADGNILEEGTPEELFGNPGTARLQSFLANS
ncbi:Arginine transport ATP-binding protein ArtM [bioreactor metagenome]|uniref:Arginine transport ATP-binding protein ArtM n=1 Tax=bioreactor metagenome TaxID=1076179 RepID=A0A645AWS1_9ZZZZ